MPESRKVLKDQKDGACERDPGATWKRSWWPRLKQFEQKSKQRHRDFNTKCKINIREWIHTDIKNDCFKEWMNKGGVKFHTDNSKYLCRHSPQRSGSLKPFPLNMSCTLWLASEGTVGGRAVRESLLCGAENLADTTSQWGDQDQGHQGSYVNIVGLLICCGENTFHLCSLLPQNPSPWGRHRTKPSWAAIYKIPDQYFSELSRHQKQGKSWEIVTLREPRRHED